MTIVHTEIEKMYKVMNQYDDFGAADTEPRGIFAQLLLDQLQGVAVSVPITPDGWEIFSDMEHADEVAQELHKQATKVIEVADANHRAAVEAFTYYYGSPF